MGIGKSGRMRCRLGRRLGVSEGGCDGFGAKEEWIEKDVKC